MKDSVLKLARKKAVAWVNTQSLFDLVTQMPSRVFDDAPTGKGTYPRVDPLNQKGEFVRTKKGPDLGKMRKGVKKKPVTIREATELAKKVRTRMSPAARKAVSRRMKKYWADRRKAKSQKK